MAETKNFDCVNSCAILKFRYLVLDSQFFSPSGKKFVPIVKGIFNIGVVFFSKQFLSFKHAFKVYFFYGAVLFKKNDLMLKNSKRFTHSVLLALLKRRTAKIKYHN